MSSKYLGDSFDIHGGGVDLIFPHHENEIAQSEAAWGKPFARYWMHNGMIIMGRGEGAEGDGVQKMSKSLGNVVGLRETLERIGGPALRYYYIAASYGSDIPFTEEALDQAQSALERLRIGRQTIDRLLSRPAKNAGPDLRELEQARRSAETDFHEAMDDDFSTPRALAALHGLVGAVNRLGADASASFAASDEGSARLATARDTLVGLGKVLGLSLAEGQADRDLENELIRLLVDLRHEARQAGQYAIGDVVRTRLAELGIVLEDRPDGTTWRRK
jgi:cysteinyl-tRNA synthetase